jgi:hypothetical protein
MFRTFHNRMGITESPAANLVFIELSNFQQLVPRQLSAMSIDALNWPIEVQVTHRERSVT